MLCVVYVCVCVCVCVTEIWGDRARNKTRHHFILLTDAADVWWCRWLWAAAASATQQQNISAASPSSAKYKTEPEERQSETQSRATRTGRTRLPLRTAEDETIEDERLTVPKKTKMSNLNETHNQ